MRSAGILLPVASLPSPYGIGTLGKAAYDFVDFLKKAGQTYWQVLPMGPTSYGDSPYQSFCTFAGNPYFIDPDMLVDDGLLTAEDCKAHDAGEDPRYVDYGKLYNTRFQLLNKAYECAEESLKKDRKYKKFKKENADWLEEYSLFMALKDAFGGKSWIEWDEPIRNREKTAVKEMTKKYSRETEFYKFMQYVFYCQWDKLKKYANDKGIKIIGDIPIYVAFDSSDAWADRELFQFDEEGRPKAVAGCPPDAYAVTGQLWGNPLYDWTYQKKTDFAWWKDRMRAVTNMYDVVRIDHFRGFDEYYSIPYGDPTAEFGHWEKGPGYALFRALKQELGDFNVIVEDLGFITDSVRKLVKRTGWPNMKVVQFGFGGGNDRGDSEYLPCNFDKNCVVYTGTHDNDTLLGWFKALPAKDKKIVRAYAGVKKKKAEAACLGIVRMAVASSADMCIIPLQDYLLLDTTARINTPSTLGENWKWRLYDDELNTKLAKKIYRLNRIYGRTNTDETQN